MKDCKDYVGRLSTDLSSDEYHGMEGSYSSSQLKTIIQDPEKFYRMYITKEEAKEEVAAFAVGTYFHSLILEPEKIDEECAVYSGTIRRGKEWDTFKEKNKGKCIITLSEKETVDDLVESYKRSPVSVSMIENSKPEVSAFAKIYVVGKEVFCFKKDVCYNLNSTGWVPTSLEYEDDEIKDFGIPMIIKVRADSIKLGEGYISDLKSTTGNAKNTFDMQQKVAALNYDLSAALYLDIFSIVDTGEYENFIWIFASKDFHNCKSYRASDKNIMVGRAKWKKAVCEIAKYKSNGWKFVDELGEIGPTFYNQEWLKE